MSRRRHTRGAATTAGLAAVGVLWWADGVASVVLATLLAVVVWIELHTDAGIGG